MKLAVIRTGGKQYLVTEGQTLSVEMLPGKADGDAVSFEALMVDTGTDVSVGMPALSGSVTGKVIENGRGVKKIVVKYKAKSRYHKKRGHRQPFSKVAIEKI